MDLISIIITFLILLFSVVIHEVSHGVVADRLGDHTARYAGRLTLNPLPHLDLFGSILMPLFLWIATQGQFVFGAAKPVPVNFFNLREPKRDMVLVSLAVPGANFFLALAFALPLRLGLLPIDSYGSSLLLYVMWINLMLGIFNILPIPPLDGSKVFSGLLTDRYLTTLFVWERYGFLLIFLLLFTGLLAVIIFPVLGVAVPLLSGISVGKAYVILKSFGFIR